MRQAHGFTLIELMVVMGIAAVLATLAAPSFTRLLQSNTISSNVNLFLADMRFARSESIRLGGAVVVCRSNLPEATAPSCMGSPDNRNWVTGWIVFQDLDNNGAKDATDPLLRVQAPITGMDTITDNGASTSTTMRFTATGRLLSLTNVAQLTFGGGNYSSEVQRVVCINLSGRARIAGDGNTSCSTDR